MTLDEKLEKIFGKDMEKLITIGQITIGSLYFALFFIMPVVKIIKSDPKSFNLSKDNIIYSIVAYKNGDTNISVYQKYTPPKELSIYKDKFKIEENEDIKHLKNCIIPRKKIIQSPYIKTYREVERRTEEYIMPTEKELNDCYNINQTHQ